jgi:hypothetical protein
MTEQTCYAAPAMRRRAWMPAFLAELAQTGSVTEAARAVRIDRRTTYAARDRDPGFAADWQQAVDVSRARHLPADLPALPRWTSESLPEAPAKRPSRQWRNHFFEALAETSDVTAAAARARVTTATVYKLRREDRDFAEKWQAALHEGYDNLEIELLGYLRNPRPGRKMDVAAALRLLAAHRETVERRRALTAEEDELVSLESLDQFIEDMRQRRAANTAILIEAQAEDGAE